MVRHDYPRPQFIILSMPETERVFNDLGDFRPLEMTSSPPLVQVNLQLDPSLAVVLDLQQRLPFGTQFFRERIRESKGDELNQPWFVAVRKITILMPAQKPALNVRLGKRTRPLALALHQIPGPGIVRRTGEALGIHAEQDSHHAAR